MQLKGYSTLFLLAATFLALPLTANAQNLALSADALEAGPHVEVNHGPVAIWRGGGEVSITHSEVPDFLNPGGGVSCGNQDGGYTTQNSYYRLFDLAEFGITDDVTVTDVDMGIRITLNGNDPQTSTLNFWAVDGDFTTANMTLIGAADFVIDDGMSGDPQIVNIPVDGITIPGGSTFAFEWDAPTGNPADTGLEMPFDIRYGFNDLGETGPTYLASEACGIIEPTATGDIGDFGHLHWVLVINGVTGGVANEDGAVAQSVSLGQNYPNPVVGRTTVPFTLERAEQVRVSVVDALGREVLVAADEAFAAGPQTVELDLSGLPSGIYIYRVATATESFSQKLVVMQ